MFLFHIVRVFWLYILFNSVACCSDNVLLSPQKLLIEVYLCEIASSDFENLYGFLPGLWGCGQICAPLFISVSKKCRLFQHSNFPRLQLNKMRYMMTIRDLPAHTLYIIFALYPNATAVGWWWIHLKLLRFSFHNYLWTISLSCRGIYILQVLGVLTF